jgi:hypothetical protein
MIAAEKLAEEFACTSVLTTHDVQGLLLHLRDRALLASDDNREEINERISSTFATLSSQRYLVTCRVQTTGSQCVITVLMTDSKSPKALVRLSDTADLNGAGNALSVIDKLVGKLVEEAAYFEICPYKGPVKLEIITTRSEDDRLEYVVSCNGGDYPYVKTTSHQATSSLNLDVQKVRRRAVNGSIRYTAFEETTLVESDPCHACASGRKGPRVYTEITKSKTEINGLSGWTSEEANIFRHARLYLKFDRNGTYRLEVVAASEEGTREEVTERKAEGTCDTVLAEPKTTKKVAVDIAPQHIFGPFTGSPMDKVLTGNDEFRHTDPVTGEVLVIKVSFELRRG